jgi:hypothetical protein
LLTFFIGNECVQKRWFGKFAIASNADCARLMLPLVLKLLQLDRQGLPKTNA